MRLRNAILSMGTLSNNHGASMLWGCGEDFIVRCFRRGVRCSYRRLGAEAPSMSLRSLLQRGSREEKQQGAGASALVASGRERREKKWSREGLVPSRVREA
jgi:hypothetical protein